MAQMIYTTPLEQKMLDKGYDSFSLQEKNSLVTILANRENLIYSAITDAYILNHHKTLKQNILSENCESTIIGGFTATNGHIYRTNRDDQVNMLGKRLQIMLDPTITTVMWKTEDAGYIQHTKEEWIAVFDEALKHKEVTLYKYNTLKLQLINATTDSQVLAVAWS